MLVTERKSRLSELLAKLAELCPDRITKGTFGGWEMRVKGALLALREDAANPVDEALIVLACLEEANQRDWFLEFWIGGNDFGKFYFSRIDFDEKGEVQSTEETPAISLLQTLVKALELWYGN